MVITPGNHPENWSKTREKVDTISGFGGDFLGLISYTKMSDFTPTSPGDLTLPMLNFGHFEVADRLIWIVRNMSILQQHGVYNTGMMATQRAYIYGTGYRNAYNYASSAKRICI